MTVPFWCLFVVIVIPYVLALITGYFRATQLGGIDNKHPRLQVAQLKGAGARAWAAQQNTWEAIPVFAISVFVNHLKGDADPGTSALLAQVFVAARLLHSVVYIANLDILRSAIFFVAYGCCIGLFFV